MIRSFFLTGSFIFLFCTVTRAQFTETVKAHEKIKIGNTNETRFAWLLKAFEHHSLPAIPLLLQQQILRFV